MAVAGTIRHRLVDDPSQRRFHQFDADFLTHFSPEAVVGSLPAFEESPGSEPRSSFRFWLDADEDDRPAAVMDQSARGPEGRSEEHTSELQSPLNISYAVFCLKKKKKRAELTHITFSTQKKKK